MSNRSVEVDGEVLVELSTDEAFRFFDGTREVWLPRSQCEWDEASGVMSLPEWLALEKELI